MDGLRTKEEYSGTSVKSVLLGSYDTGKNGSCKTRNISPHDSAKRGRHKGGRSTSTYAPGEDLNKTEETQR